MSEQQIRGTLASGGTFTATGRGVEIFDPGGSSLAYFGREVISGVNRNGQVVTIERHADTIVTLTAASITDAVGLEQFVRDNFVAAPPAADQSTPPLAFDAFDREPEQATAQTPPAPRPAIISRPEPASDEQPTEPREPLPPPTPTIAPPPPPLYSEPVVHEQPEPIAPMPQPVTPPPPAYRVEPQPSAPPPTQPVYPEPAVDEERKGRSKWLWGCLGCGGLIVLSLICIGVLIATEVIDPDDFDDDADDSTPTPFIIIATSEEGNPTEDTGSADDATATSEESAIDSTATQDTAATSAPDPGAPTATEDPTSGGTGNSTQIPAEDLLQAGEIATVNGIEATYQSSRIDDTGLIPPDPGNEYLVLSFQFVNTTQEPRVVSSLLQFELRDSAGEAFSVALFADIETGVDAEIAAGETLDGEVAFEVPADGGPYTITFLDLLTQESASWTVEPA